MTRKNTEKTATREETVPSPKYPSITLEDIPGQSKNPNFLAGLSAVFENIPNIKAGQVKRLTILVDEKEIVFSACIDGVARSRKILISELDKLKIPSAYSAGRQVMSLILQEIDQSCGGVR